MKRFIFVLACWFFCCASPACADDTEKLPKEFLGLWQDYSHGSLHKSGLDITDYGMLFELYIDRPEFGPEINFEKNFTMDHPSVHRLGEYKVIQVDQENHVAYLLIRRWDGSDKVKNEIYDYVRLEFYGPNDFEHITGLNISVASDDLCKPDLEEWKHFDRKSSQEKIQPGGPCDVEKHLFEENIYQR